ncbi:MAG: pilus assembly protein PilP [Acidiferrobacter sp.]
MASLQHFVATADAGYHPPVKPVPKIPPPEIVAFNMHHFIDPFEPFTMRLPMRGPNPNLHIPKGPLQHYPLDALTMVGTLSSGRHLWALVMTPDSSTHRVEVGTYIGEHYGRIVRITPQKIYVVETVAGPTGWVKQPVTLEIK